MIKREKYRRTPLKKLSARSARHIIILKRDKYRKTPLKFCPRSARRFITLKNRRKKLFLREGGGEMIFLEYIYP